MLLSKDEGGPNPYLFDYLLRKYYFVETQVGRKTRAGCVTSAIITAVATATTSTVVVVVVIVVVVVVLVLLLPYITNDITVTRLLEQCLIGCLETALRSSDRE